jgi:hypothetical protein
MFHVTLLARRTRFRAGHPFPSIFRTGQINRRFINRGNLSPQELGDPSTESAVYRSANITAQLKSRKAAEQRLTEQRLSSERGSLSAATERGLDKGLTEAKTEAERQTLADIDDEDMQLRRVSRGEMPRRHENAVERRSSDYSPAMHAAASIEARRKEDLAFKHMERPVAKEFNTLFRKLNNLDDDERKISEAQVRLTEEFGIYATHRIDAYMLGEDTNFPPWVEALPWGIRDRVKYGGLGLTEEDEALRIRFARLPVDQRADEWKRLKAAREFELGQERRLSLSELREARGGKRRFHWLQRKRQMRATMLRRLAMRKPERFEVWPSDAVDYSARLALVAQHVENGVETKGQWPLDKEAVARAKIRRKQEEAERTFLRTTDEKKMLQQKNMNGSIASALQLLEEKTKKFKKLSRRAFANRANAIRHGDQDIHGRNTKWLQRRISHRHRAYGSMSELALEKEIRKEPLVHIKGRSKKDNENWPDEGMARGMPSMRYGY